ncbi:unnamed protein product [Chrysoparadoxa australica]
MQPPRVPRRRAARVLIKAHAKRLALHVALSTVLVCCLWEVATVLRLLGGGYGNSRWYLLRCLELLLADVPAITSAALCHIMCAYSRYSTLDALPKLAAPPRAVKVLVMLLTHAACGLVLGWCLFDVLSRGSALPIPFMVRLSPTVDVCATLAMGAMLSSLASAVMFLYSRSEQVSLPHREELSVPVLKQRALAAIEAGGKLGAALVAGNLLLHCLSGAAAVLSVAEHLLGASMPAASAASPPRQHLLTLAVAPYLALLGILVHSLQEFLSHMLVVLIGQPVSFKCMAEGGRDSDAVALLYETLSMGKEGVLADAEIVAKGREKELVKPAIRTELHSSWRDEVQRQHATLEKAVLFGLGEMGMGLGGLQGRGRSAVEATLPLWGQLAYLQAQQALAKQVPENKKLRSAIYSSNITELVRCCCLIMDLLNVQLQALAFTADKGVAAKILKGNYVSLGSTPVRWLASDLLKCQGSTQASKPKEPKEPKAALPLLDTWHKVTKAGKGAVKLQLQSQRPPVRLREACLSGALAQSAVWIIDGTAQLIIQAPGESPTTAAERMVPCVLNSLAGLQLSVTALGLSYQAAAVPITDATQLMLHELSTISLLCNEAIARVVTKYRFALSAFSFPNAYAEVIARASTA